MEQITERIAGVSLSTVLFVLVCLTVMRVGLTAARITVFRSIADLLESMIIAIGLVFLILRPFIVQSFYIPSGSMHPTLWEGDHILVNKWVYRTQPPQVAHVRPHRYRQVGDRRYREERRSPLLPQTGLKTSLFNAF